MGRITKEEEEFLYSKYQEIRESMGKIESNFHYLDFIRLIEIIKDLNRLTNSAVSELWSKFPMTLDEYYFITYGIESSSTKTDNLPSSISTNSTT